MKSKPHEVRDKSHDVEIAVLPKALNNVFKISNQSSREECRIVFKIVAKKKNEVELSV